MVFKKDLIKLKKIIIKIKKIKKYTQFTKTLNIKNM